MKFIEIKLTKCRLYLTESEIRHLLSRDIELYKEALMRGKAIKRAEDSRKRINGKN